MSDLLFSHQGSFNNASHLSLLKFSTKNQRKLNEIVPQVILTFVCPCIVSIFVIDDQQDATVLVYLFIYPQSALHVSGEVFAHHQEHLTVFTASDIVH